MPLMLVTGGAGFIGSHLVRALLARGERVRVLDNFSTGRRENLAGLSGPLEVLEGDLRDPARVAEAVRGVAAVFHQAAFVSVPQSLVEPETCFEVNAHGTLNLFEAARRAGVGQVVQASTCALYGDSQALPLKEDSPLRARSPYAASKQTAEVYAGFYSRAFDLPVVSLRYFNVFGPRQSPDSDYAAVIPIFIRRLLNGKAVTVNGDGHQTRDFISVSDVVRANLLAAECDQAAGEVFNVCTGRETSLMDLLEGLSEILPGGLAPEFAAPRPGDIYHSVGDPEKAALGLGFRAQVSLSEGLAETVAGLKNKEI